jgi:hypothetical protein
VRVTREWCWQYDWVLELDIKGLFDNIDHELLLRAVREHTECKWVILYIERRLKALFCSLRVTHYRPKSPRPSQPRVTKRPPNSGATGRERNSKMPCSTDEPDASGNLLPDERRLTTLGRVLRSTSLDELPELFNVFKGEMSLVGATASIDALSRPIHARATTPP